MEVAYKTETGICLNGLAEELTSSPITIPYKHQV